MAREFIIIDRPTARIRVLALFRIPPAVKVAGVIPTPSSDLPEEISDSLDPTENSQLDAGSLTFRVLTLRPFEVEPPPELSDLGLPKKVYRAARAVVLREYSQTYSPAGRGDRVDGA